MVHDGKDATVRVEFSPGVVLHNAGRIHVLRRGAALPPRKTAYYGISPSALLLDARQFRALSGFLGASTPQDVFRRVREDGWRVADFKYFVYVLVMNRILRPTEESIRGVSAAAKRESIGVILLALGAEYVKMACSLAATIRVGNPELPIALVHDGEVGEGLLGAFDHQIRIDPAEYGQDGRVSPYLMKLYMDTLTPFDRTIYMDADSAIFPTADLTREIASFGSCDIAPCVSLVIDPKEHPRDEIFWFSVSVGALLDFGVKSQIARVHSYFYYFRKNKRTAAYFEECRRIFRRLAKLKAYQHDVPDEIALSLATACCDVSVYSAFYLPFVERAGVPGLPIPIDHAQRHSLGVTMIGHDPDPSLVGLYDLLVASAAQRNGAKIPVSPWGYQKPNSLG